MFTLVIANSLWTIFIFYSLDMLFVANYCFILIMLFFIEYELTKT